MSFLLLSSLLHFLLPSSLFAPFFTPLRLLLRTLLHLMFASLLVHIQHLATRGMFELPDTARFHIYLLHSLSCTNPLSLFSNSATMYVKRESSLCIQVSALHVHVLKLILCLLQPYLILYCAVASRGVNSTATRWHPPSNKIQSNNTTRYYFAYACKLSICAL